MKVAQPLQQKASQRYAWVILFVLSTLLVVNIVIVAGVEDHAKQFKADTGVAWDDFTTAYPGIAATYVLNQRLLYVSFAGLALVAVVITYFGLRQGHRSAWFVMWLIAASLVLMAALFAPSKRPEIGLLYGAFAAVMVIGLLLPIRKFFPKQSWRG